MTDDSTRAGGVSEGSGEGDLTNAADQAVRVGQDDTDLDEVEVVLQVPLGMVRVARERGLTPAELAQEWVAQMLATVGADRMISLQGALQTLRMLPDLTPADPPASDVT